MRKFGPVTKFLTKWLRNRAIAFCSIPQLPKELRQGTGLPEPPQLPRAEQHEPFLGSPGARQAFEDLLFFFFFSINNVAAFDRSRPSSFSWLKPGKQRGKK